MAQFVPAPWQWSATFQFGVNSKNFEVSVIYGFFTSFKEIIGWVNEYLMTLSEMTAKVKASVELIENGINQFDLPGAYHVNDLDAEKEAKSFFSEQLRNYIRFQNLDGGKLLE